MKYQKYVNAMFLLAAVLIWFITQHYTGELIVYFQLSRKFGTLADVLEHAAPILIAAISWYFLRFNDVCFNFVSDCIGELVRVEWPTQKDVKLGTIVVLITVITMGALLGFLDLGLTSLIKVIIGA